MDTNSDRETSVSHDDVNTGNQDAESSKIDLVVEMSSNGEMSGKLGNAAEVVIRVELDLACVSEKLVNLSVLMMTVATKESDFEAFASEKGQALDDPVTALDFDLLCGILDSEVTEVDMFLTDLRTDIVGVYELLSSCKHLGEDTIMAVEEKLHDSEKSLQQSQDQISEIREQCSKFQRTFSCLDIREIREDDKGPNFLEEEQSVSVNAKISMQTAEQQRHILRMLEKSLAREMDIEKKLTESRQVEEQLKHRILSLEQEVFFTEEETLDVYEKYFGAENASEVLMSISKELLGRLQIFQFNLNGTVQREAELRSKLEKCMEQLEEKDSALEKFNDSNAEVNGHLVGQIDDLKASLRETEDKLVLANSESFTMIEKISLLEKQLAESETQILNKKVSVDEIKEKDDALHSEMTEMENTINVLKDKLSDAESRAENAEGKYKLMEETNSQLNGHLVGQIDDLKASLRETEDKLVLANSESFTMIEKISLLEKQLAESETQILNKKVSVDEIKEKDDALHSEMTEMENTINVLKDKLSDAESRAENAEGKYKLMEETNSQLNDELGHLRGICEKVEPLERQLKDTDIRLQHAVATSEASQEKQDMLYTTIGDMENLIEDLKLKVSKAESQADSKCIKLSKSNEELGFLRSRLKCLELSLNQAEETKMETAKDIRFRTKVITDLVLQLAIERERLCKQMSSLAAENRTLVLKLQRTRQDPPVVSHQKPEATEFSATDSEFDKSQENAAIGETKIGSRDAMSELEPVRRIDVGLLNFKHVFVAVLILLISAGVYFSQPRIQ